MRTRKELPFFAKLPYQFDVEALRQELYANHLHKSSRYDDLFRDGQFQHLCTEQQRLHLNFLNDEERRYALSKGEIRGESYKQLSLTEYNPSYGITEPEKLQRIEQKTRSIRASTDVGREHYVPEKDERNYDQLKEWVPDYFMKVIGSFKGHTTRIRLAYMEPGFSIQPHIDYDPSYSVRYHIALMTNPNCFLGCIDKQGRRHEIHIPDDGSVWFLNTGYKHYAVNKGSSPRIHLVISCRSQEDLELAEHYSG